MQLMADVIRRNARRFPDELAFVFEEKRFTFKEYEERVNKLANALIRMGVEKGDRIGVILDNCHQHCEIMGAVAKTGFVMNPLSTGLIEELNYFIGNAEPSVMIVGDNHTHKVRPEWKSVKQVICVGETPSDMTDYEQLIAQSPADELEVEVTEEDGLYLLYTSGTTALPKGIYHTNGSMESMWSNMIWSNNIKYHRERGITAQPMYFIAPLNCVIQPLMYAASPTVIMGSFDPQTFLETIAKERVTMTYMVPTMLYRLIEYPDLDKYDISSLTKIIYGSAPIPVAVLKKAVEKFGRIFSQIYGQTEFHIATSLPADEHVVEGTEREIRRLASCGREMPDFQVRVVREDGTDINRDLEEKGEIICKGATMMKEYFRMPEKTAQTIKDGWVHTGDVAAMDEDGYIYIKDRKHDMIISGGINIYPREIEEVLYTHPAVKEAAVIGEPDDEWGEKVTAYIALRPGMTVSEQEIIDYTKGKLATYKKPKLVEFVDELPKSSRGKILKRELREGKETE